VSLNFYYGHDLILKQKDSMCFMNLVFDNHIFNFILFKIFIIAALHAYLFSNITNLSIFFLGIL
jgi:hypothetical protein